MPTPPFVGPEFQVNTTTAGQQSIGSVAVLPTGQFVVVWEDFSETGGDTSANAVRGQIFNADGSKAGGEFLVNQTTVDNQDDPVVTALSDGRFVVAWTDASGSNEDIRARIYNRDGTPAGNEFLVGTGLADDENQPAIAALANGGFVITWTNEFEGNDPDIEARVFAADGTPLTNDVPVDINVVTEEDSAVVGLANGNFAVVWTDQGFAGETDGSGTHIRGAIFSPNGTEVVGEFVVNTTTANDQFTPSIARLANGSFIVTWSENGPVSADLRARIFSEDGVPLGPDFPIDTDGSFSFGPSVAALLDGSYTVMWNDGGAASISISGEVFAGSGNSLTDEFTVNTTTGGLPGKPVVTTLADGRVVVVWTEFEDVPGDQGGGIRAQIIDPRTSGVNITGTDLDDEYTGTAFNDFMKAGGGADRLDGAGGDDLLFGGQGADILIGGAGFDVASYGTSASAVVVNLATGINTGGDAQGDTLSGIEAVGGSQHGDAIAGDAKDNLLQGFDSPDGLFGAGGNDVLDGGEGPDNLNGGDGIDTASYDGAAAAIVLDLRTPSLNTGDAAGDAFVSIERFLGSEFNDRIEGDASDNFLDGNAGDDIINGNGGNDRLAGGPGADMLNGGAGTDTADYLGEGAGVTVDLAAGTAATASGIDTLTSIERLLGSQFADTLRGNDGDNVLDGASGVDVVEGFGGNDRLEGGSGDDTLSGGAGNDELVGQSGFDTADYSGSFGSAGVVVDLRNGTATGGAGNDTLSGIERVFGSDFADTLHGNDETNFLFGNGGADVLNGNGGIDALGGGDGNDTITGGLDDDEVFGGAGNDRLVWNPGDGNDEVDGGEGTDTFDVNGNGSAEFFVISAAAGGAVRVSRNTSDVEVLLKELETIDLDAGAGDDIVTMAGLSGTDLVSVRLTLGAGNDVLSDGSTTIAVTAFGQDGNDVLLAGSGNDKLNGDAGNDTLRGGGGSDQLQGGDGDDRLDGGLGDDHLQGGDGNDRLDGGFGDDALIGGAGTDTADYLNDGPVALDLAAGTGVTPGGTDSLTSIERMLGSQFDDTIRGNGGDNVLDGGSGIDVIDGLGGNDRVEGGAGNDQLKGGDGNDEVIGQSGNDTLDAGNGDDLVRGGGGDDVIEGRDGNDRLEGEAGADTIDAGDGNDLLFGGDGNDRLFAAGGTDTLTGGAGNDQFFYTNPAPGQMNGDTITDFQSVAGGNTGDSLVILPGFSNIAFNNGSTAITYNGVTETIFHPGVQLSLANDIDILLVL